MRLWVLDIPRIREDFEMTVNENEFALGWDEVHVSCIGFLCSFIITGLSAALFFAGRESEL